MLRGDRGVNVGTIIDKDPLPHFPLSTSKFSEIAVKPDVVGFPFARGHTQGHKSLETRTGLLLRKSS